MNDSDGVLLIGHGTRDENGTREFFELACELGRRCAPVPVEGCLLEFQRPTIAEGWDALVASGVKQIHVAPLLLFAAGHAKQDIPDAIRECALRTPEIGHLQTGPLSRSRSIIDLVTRRVSEAAQQHQITIDSSTAVVFVGRGSYDPCAQADMRLLGEIVASRLSLQHHAVAFYAMAEPRLPEVLDQVACTSGVANLIVQPHLLFQGRLYDAIKRQVNEAMQRHPAMRFFVGEYLGPVAAVADAIASRIEATSVRGAPSRQ
ncbi:MAG: sirohydrochlorin chelatase [Planctomycetota bacterium]